jgi:phosphatidylglycerol:prolipoprotein diacylglycerol transferase
MFPYITISLFGSSTMMSTSLFLDLCCVPIAFVALWVAFKKELPLWKIFTMVFAVAASAWIGARLFHVIWERPDYFKAHPAEILTNFQGMTFYGALIAGFFTVLLLNRILIPKSIRARMLDVSAIIAAAFYGLLRIGCFADGCCWGKLSRLPWAVRFFDPNSEMPFLGIPVHPVQLYDSFAGFLIAGILIYLYRNQALLRGRLIWIFFCLYSIARVITENFRGDSYRGVNLFLGLSTSQLISVGLFTVGALALWATAEKSMRSRSVKSSKLVLASLIVSFLSGCLQLPHAPDEKTLTALNLPQKFQGSLSDDDFKGLELYHAGPIKADPSQEPNRNLVFVALDQTFQAYFDADLKKIYNTTSEVRIEELAWWVFAPEFNGLYDQVLRVSYDHFSSATLQQSLDYMETQGKPYDVVLLTHGIPNNIMTTKGQPLLTWQDVDSWKGRFSHLDLLFMQSCYGDSLVQDWKDAGAKAVMGYSGLNRNFFFPMTLFRIMKKEFTANPTQGQSDKDRITTLYHVFNESTDNVTTDIEKSGLDKFMITGLGLSVQDYLLDSPSPDLNISIAIF